MRRLGAWLREALEAEQDRWFLWVPVLFGAGIALYFTLPKEPPIAAALVPVVAALAARAVWGQSWGPRLLLGAIAATAMGFTTAKLRTDWTAAPVLQRQIGPVDVRGWVELVEPRPERGQRVTLRVFSVQGLREEEQPVRVRVRLARVEAALQPGQGVALSAHLSPPAGPALPGGYDFARTAWFQGIGAVGHTQSPVQPDPALSEVTPRGLQIRASIERLRQAIGARITAAVPGETGHIANALITGERGGISEATNSAYRDSGLLHILSISGLHMAIMAGAVFIAVRFLLALVPALALRFAIKKWAAVAAALGALGYLLISGASFPTVRSYIMISIMFLAVMLDRPALAMRNVALAALAILLVLPESLIDVGFQMSFAAVVALIAGYELLHERQRGHEGRRGIVGYGLIFIGGIVLSTLIASLAVAPFAAYHFHKSQQYAVLANLIAIPICNIIAMPAALATLLAMPFGLEWAPLQVMAAGIDAMTWCAQRVAALPGAVGTIAAIPTSTFALMVAGGLWLALWRTRWRLLGLVPCALGAAVASQHGQPDVLIGRDGSLVAVRAGKEGLSAIGPRSAMFELGRWLEHDGDRRQPEAVATGQAFRCDGAGCTATVGTRTIAVARHASALRDDCDKAALLIIAIPAGVACRGAPVVIPQERVKRLGAHAVRWKQDAIDIETVADARGLRPWTVATAAEPPAPRLYRRPPFRGETSSTRAHGRTGRWQQRSGDWRRAQDDEP